MWQTSQQAFTFEGRVYRVQYINSSKAYCCILFNFYIRRKANKKTIIKFRGNTSIKQNSFVYHFQAEQQEVRLEEHDIPQKTI